MWQQTAGASPILGTSNHRGRSRGLIRTALALGVVVVVALAGIPPQAEALLAPRHEGPHLTFLPATADFGRVRVGEVSDWVAVANGWEELGWTEQHVVTVNTTDGFDYEPMPDGQIWTCTQTFCTMKARFAPTVAGPQNPTIEIFLAEDGTHLGTWTGTGIGVGEGGGLTPMPPALDFGEVAEGASAALDGKILNNGDESVRFISANVTGPFTFSTLPGSACALDEWSLSSGAQCTYTVTYTPPDFGIHAGTLELETDLGYTVTVDLEGTSSAGPVAELTLSPTTVDFGTVDIGVTSPPETVTVRNDGEEAVQVSAGSTAPFSILDTTCGMLEPAATCEVRVRARPTTAGERTGRLRVSVAGRPEVFDATLVVTGGSTDPGGLEASPTSVDFGSVEAGTTSPASVVTVENSGTAPVSVASVTAAAPFRVAGSDCAGELGGGQTCQVDVVYEPTSSGSHSANLEITPVTGTAVQVALSGTATAAPVGELSVTPTSIDFGAVEIGAAATVRTVDVSNTGTAPIALDGYSAPAPFSVDAGSDCGSSLAAGASCSILVGYSPTALGSHSGMLSINPIASPAVTVALSGTGTEVPRLSIDPVSNDFARVQVGGSSPAFRFTVRNDGVASRPIDTVAVPAPFVVDATTCTTLAGGATCSVDVVFRPTMSGAANATLTVGSGATTATATVTGTGVDAFAVSPGSLDFANVLVGTTSAAQRVTVHNTDSAAITIDASVASPFTVDTSGCAAALAPDATCELSVRYAPGIGDRGNATAELEISDGLSAASVALTAFAEFRAATVTEQIDFGAVRLDASSTGTLTIANGGNVAMTISPPTLPAEVAVVGTPCWSAPLAAGQTCDTTLRFTPVDPGPFDQTVQLTTGFGGFGTRLVGLGRPLAVDPTNISVGAVTVGHTASAEVTVTNLAEVAVPLAVSALTTPLAHDGGCPDPLPAGASCTIDVSFAPTAGADANGSFTVVTPTDGSTQSVAVTVTGRGVAASLVVDPIDAGDVPVGGTAHAAATLRNAGDGALTITGVDLPAPFAVADPAPCLTTLAPGATCVLEVTFTPTEVGAATSTLTVHHLAGRIDVAVAGRGTTAGLDADGIDDFGVLLPATTSAPNPVTFTNTGNVDLLLAAPELTSPFELGASTCTGTLAAGASCAIQVRYHPGSAAAGPEAGLLALTGTQAEETATASIDLSGFAATTGLDVAPPAHDFGSVAVDRPLPPRTTTITNRGNVPVALTIAVEGDPSFGVDDDACTAALAPDASCDLTITYSPHTVATSSASVAIAGRIQLAGGPHDVAAVPVALSGESADVDLSGDGDRDFGDVAAGTPTDAHVVTVTNHGVDVGIARIAAPDGFVVVDDTCTGAALATGASCTVAVAVGAGADGPVGGDLLLITDSGVEVSVAAVHAVAVSGVLVAPDTVDLGSVAVGATATGQVTIVNGLNVASTVTAIQIGGSAFGAASTLSATAPFGLGSSGGPFRVELDGCTGRTLAPGESCALTVAFAPQVVGSAAASLSVTTDRATRTIDLSGTGVAVPGASDPGPGAGGPSPIPELPATGTSAPARLAALAMAVILLGLATFAGSRRRTA